MAIVGWWMMLRHPRRPGSAAQGHRWPFSPLLFPFSLRSLPCTAASHLRAYKPCEGKCPELAWPYLCHTVLARASHWPAWDQCGRAPDAPAAYQAAWFFEGHPWRGTVAPAGEWKNGRKDIFEVPSRVPRTI